jgi:hypothetical protein
MDLRPVAAVQDWLRASGIEAGPVFRSVDRHALFDKRAISMRAEMGIR